MSEWSSRNHAFFGAFDDVAHKPTIARDVGATSRPASLWLRLAANLANSASNAADCSKTLTRCLGILCAISTSRRKVDVVKRPRSLLVSRNLPRSAISRR